MTATIPEIPRPVASNHRSLPVDFVGEFVGEGTVEGLVLNVEWKFLEWNYFFFFRRCWIVFFGLELCSVACWFVVRSGD